MDEKADKVPISYIPIDECIEGHVYRIRARNGRIGIFEKKGPNWFVLSRHKFSDNFLYPEYHWDNGEPNGTVKPLEHLGEAPEFKNDQEKLNYLNGLTETVKGEEYPEYRDIMKKWKNINNEEQNKRRLDNID